MSRDPNLVKRNAFVIPGALLALVCLVGILYGMLLRPDPGYGCAYGGAGMLLWGQCYHVVTVFTPPLVLAVFLILFGMLRYRGHPDELEDHLHPGTGQHTLLALLIGIFAVPLVLWIGIKVAQRRDDVTYILPVLGTRYEMSFLLELGMLLGVLMLLPFLVAYLAQGRMRHNFLHAAQELTRDAEGEYDDDFAPLGDDEGLVPLPEDEPGAAVPGAWAAEDEDAPWQDLPVAAGNVEGQDEEARAATDGERVGGEEPGPAWDEAEEATETPGQQLEAPAYRAVRARPEDTFADDPDAAPLADEWDENN